MSRIDLRTKVAFLADPAHYAQLPGTVETIETHFAWVFLTARHVYKLKKPIRHASMDYRSLQARKRGCLRELRLNRRLAPQVYERVLALASDRHGQLHIGRGPRVEDYLVRMRRLPAAAMLDQRLKKGRVGRSDLKRLIATLTRYYARAPRRPFRIRGYLMHLKSQVRCNRRSIHQCAEHLQPSLIASIAAAQLAFIAHHRHELAARARRIVDGHGDLRAEHVCLKPKVQVLDCLEFDAELRRLDPVEEVAQLGLEVEIAGHPSLARDLLEGFCSASADPVSSALLHFYLSMRALTRAKLAAWHIGDPQFPDARPWRARVRACTRLAWQHIRAANLASPPAL